MAYRSMWSGVVRFGLVNIPVGAVPALEDPHAGLAFKEICECCHKPLTRTSQCRAGKRRLTEQMKKDGDTANSTQVVKGFQVGEDEFRPVDAAAITASLASDTISVEFSPLDSVPDHIITGTYYLKVPSKQKGGEPVLALFREALASTGMAAHGIWTHHGSQHVAVIRAIGDAVVLNTVAWLDQVRDPQQVGIASTPVKAEELAVAQQLIAAQARQDFPLGSYEDEGVRLRQEALDAALSGEPLPEPSQAPAASATDLMAQLKASIAA